ncbi:hypothetical protein [Planococcus halotolerans]|uniref:hypothetical protein n=1 Tax=Planococcus halotolerans TaxID=2233542 RepID=UPI001091A656|nr:hypothetical protein [Planococcus halotolerans]QHJ70145.1 hypothetical protein DNR44_005810 [Planococcus halotolerans]
MEFKITEKEMHFENEQYASRMIIKGKGPGHDGGEARLRCAITLTIRIKGTDNEIKLTGNVYWDAKYPKTHVFFTGGSIRDFIGEQALDYAQFKTEYWDKVKRLAANVFTDKEILEYNKMMEQVKA